MERMQGLEEQHDSELTGFHLPGIPERVLEKTEIQNSEAAQSSKKKKKKSLLSLAKGVGNDRPNRTESLSDNTCPPPAKHL